MMSLEEQLAAARQIILELQRDLLPDAVPVLPRIRMAAHYVVAAPELHAGGDWFDAVPLPDGRLALVVGDVVGHGAAAAAAMSRLRTVLRESLLTGAVPPAAEAGAPAFDVGASAAEVVDPMAGAIHLMAEAVDRLDRYAATSPATRAATVCLALLDPSTGDLAWISRAHPPPLVCTPDGRARFLDTGRAAPLGVGLPSSPPARALLAPGEVVLLYSDGLVQRPGETLADGLSRLARIAGAAIADSGSSTPCPAERLCGTTVEQITRDAVHDDVTALAACLLPAAPASLELSVPAAASSLPSVRAAVSDWLLTTIGADPDDEAALTPAISEAATNVTRHAYPDRPTGELRVSLSLEDSGVVRAVVADDGAWQEPACSGRGLPLMHDCGSLNLDRRPNGTTVVIRRELRHRAVAGAVP
ncbi:SpoIIE family protein phosphatase [Actinoplanes sp. NPDC023714]|uniref:ATP-binding SpoIIE family protein phosphatase n=1 Tax=Actinoplanes sp. NPDC023714 TaxID=3154322 RepID=UPI0033CEF654